MANNPPDNIEFLDLDVGDLGDYIHNDDGSAKKGKSPGKNRYVGAIRRLRMRLGELGRRASAPTPSRDGSGKGKGKGNGNVLWTTRTRPVLPHQDDQNIRFVGLRLHARLSDHTTPATVTLLFRRDNLYLAGYLLRVGQPNGMGRPRLEARTLNNRYLSGRPRGQEEQYPDYREILPTTSQGQPGKSDGGDDNKNAENYNSLLSLSSYSSLRDIPLGRRALMDAVAALVEDPMNPEREANALLVFCFMFAEAARFEPVLEQVEMGWVNGSTRVEYWGEELVTSWRKLSLAVLQYDARVDRPRPDPGREKQETKEYAWKPKKLKIKKDVLLQIDPTMKEDIEEFDKREKDPSRALDKAGHPKPNQPRVTRLWEGDVVEIEVRTAAEMLSYLGILLLGSLLVANLHTYNLSKKHK